jgi:hypothetical protein
MLASFQVLGALGGMRLAAIKRKQEVQGGLHETKKAHSNGGFCSRRC